MNGVQAVFNHMKKRNRIYHIFYMAMAAVFFAMIIWAAVKNRGQSPAALLSEGNVVFEDGWQMAVRRIWIIYIKCLPCSPIRSRV